MVRNGRVVYPLGHIQWFKDDSLHREDGPAIEGRGGYKAWYINGIRHRIDGPAIESCESVFDPNLVTRKAWYYEGKLIKCNSQEEFEKLIKLKILW